MPVAVPNVLLLISNRERGIGCNASTQKELQKVAEEKAASSEMQEIHCKLPSSVRSTFLMSFSPDSTKVASTHGDHKIYVCDIRTGKLLHKLEGHPRTPWCLAFHPTSNDILASGCLGGEVRVWDLHGGSEKWGAEQGTVITSLTFHPLDKVLVIATCNQIHFWDWSLPEPFASCQTSSNREKVRFVKFDRLGTRLITGILNQHENLRTTIPIASLSQRYPLPSMVNNNSSLSQRRSILSRLMNMYQHMEGLEEVSRLQEPLTRPTSPMQEEALNQARHYAEVTTQASNLQRQLRDFPQVSSAEPGTSGQQQDMNSTIDSLRMDNELSDSQEELTTGDFWRTFQRLRSICSSLERRMHQLQSSTESHVTMESINDNVSWPRSEREERLPPAEIATEPTTSVNSDVNNNAVNNYRHMTSEFLINVLTRLQNSLHLSALTTAIAQEQIQQVRWRISEILERLTNVTGYRARLTNLREQIYEVAERTEQRGEESSSVRRWDLAHCLWLVEMSLQLTRQMQRILQADYRLTQLHLSSTSQSTVSDRAAPGPSGNERSRESRETSSSRNCSVCSNLPSQVSDTPQNSQRNYNSDLDQINNRRLLLMQVNREIGEFQERFRSQSEDITRINRNIGDETPRRTNRYNDEEVPIRSRSNFRNFSVRAFDTPNMMLRSMWPRYVLARTALENRILAPDPDPEPPRTSQRSLPDVLDIGEDLLTDRVNQTNARSPTVPFLTLPPDPVPHRIEWQGQHSLMRLSAHRATSRSSPSSAHQSNFYVPDVQIESSPSADDSDPLPLHERPRSPPLSTILSGANEPGFPSWGYMPPYLSLLYDAGLRPRFGIPEAVNNFTHRIQSWDFSKYEIPIISNAKANIVVPKCKIHNDASVDISKDGALLIALVPSTSPSPSGLTFAVYSLKLESLGHCLYTWAFDSNAISVSLSPLGQYVVVGLASPRLYISSSEKEAVAQIFRLKSYGKCCIATHVRSLTQQAASTGHHPQVSLNSVQWLPQPGQGLIYGTNKGCLCICKPIAPMTSKKHKILKLNRTPFEPHNLSLGIRRGSSHSTSFSQMFSASTQTIEPQTQTTGTQTFGSEGNTSR